MDIKRVELRVEEVLAEMTVEELEEKIAPVDCNKKPNHPDCQAVLLYGVQPNPNP